MRRRPKRSPKRAREIARLGAKARWQDRQPLEPLHLDGKPATKEQIITYWARLCGLGPSTEGGLTQ
jgi:hypothetical protein